MASVSERRRGGASKFAVRIFVKKGSDFNQKVPHMFSFFKKTNKEPKNLKEVIAILKGLEGSVEKIAQEMEKAKKENEFSVQKVGMIRFNPFQEVGGDQSFSVALLDGKDDGVVITSHYTRTDNRIYGKPVKAGKSEYLLSEEEKRAIEKAQSAKGLLNNKDEKK